MMYKRQRLLIFGKRIGVIPSSRTKAKSQIIKIEALYVTRTLEVVPWDLQGYHLSLVSVKKNCITSPVVFVFDFGKLKNNGYSTKHLKAVTVFQFRHCRSTTSLFTR